MKAIGFATLLFGIIAQGGALKAQATTDDIDVRAYGALCNGTHDDASAINAALTAAGALVGARVMLPPGGRCLIGATLNVPAHVKLAGHGWGNGGDLWPSSANMTVISLNGSFTGVSNLWINSSLAGPNTSGTGIAMSNNQHQNVDHVLITGAFTGLDINGNTVLVDNVFVSDLPAHGIGWTIGRLGTFANTIDVRITNSTVEGNANADFNQLIYDAGGLQEINNDLIAAQYGTYIRPGANQWVVWTNFSNTVLGDTNVYGALSIDTAASSARIAGMECTGCWAASQTNGSIGANILINNSAGGTLDGLHFVGLRDYNGAGYGAYIGAGTNISFDDSHFCGMGAGKADIALTTNVSNVSVNGGQLGSSCDSQNAGATRGIDLSGNNSNIQINNVNFNGVATPVNGTPSSGSVAMGNYGILPGMPTIASAATITLNGIYPTYALSGTTGVSTIAGGWQNRQATLITTGALSFATGGNICKAYTSVANVPILATYSGSCWYLK